MDVLEIQELLKQRNADYVVAEIIYKSVSGLQINRTCFIDHWQDALDLQSFDDVPEGWQREDFKKKYREVPCLEVLCSLDRNGTGMNQPSIQLLPSEIMKIRILRPKSQDNSANEYSGSVWLKTQDENLNTKIVLGYVLDRKQIEGLAADDKPGSIEIASFLEEGKPKEIRTVSPIYGRFAMMYAPPD